MGQAHKAEQKALKAERKAAKQAAKAEKKAAKMAKCSIVDDNQDAEPVAEIIPVAAEMPTEQPVTEEAIPFEYQNEFNMVQGMGFNSSPDVVRCLLVDNKGDVTKVINTLLSSMS